MKILMKEVSIMKRRNMASALALALSLMSAGRGGITAMDST